MNFKNKKVFITGGAGFVGSNLVDRLMQEKCKIIVYDNLSLGRKEFLSQHLSSPDFKLIIADLLDANLLEKSMKGCDLVFHLAANSDIGYGAKHTDVDLKQGTIATYNVLEAMRKNDINKIVFSSTSAIYGQAKITPTPEDYGPLFPISYYGASKLACEGLISAFCESYNIRAWIFRFANVVGENGTHGAIVDFIKKLRKNPKSLEILGNGEQAKPYLYVKECVDGILFGANNSEGKLNYFNLSCDGATPVKKIADMIVKEMGIGKISYKYTGGERGWVGDVPQVRLSPQKINRLGWRAKLNSDEAVKRGIKALLKQI